MSLSRNKKVKAEIQTNLIFIQHETIYKNDFEFEIEDDHARGSNEIAKLKKILFGNCLMLRFPSARCLSKLVKNLESLRINRSKLSSIDYLDIFGFKDLVQLNLDENEIEELPGNLVYTPGLQDISIVKNKIKVIGENILDPLINLKFFDLCGNPGINVCYNPKYEKGWGAMYVSLAKFKEAIKRCKPAKELWNIGIDGIKKNYEVLKKEVTELKQSGAYQKYDFTIKVGEKEFKVQKELLIANSPLLAQMIRTNENANTLELKNITEETFEEILNFMHSRQPPKPTANLIELYAASGRLQMKELMDMCAQMIMDKVTPENALEILNLCKKYPNVELRKKAYVEYGKAL